MRKWAIIVAVSFLVVAVIAISCSRAAPTPTPTPTPKPTPTAATPALKFRWAGYASVVHMLNINSAKAVEAVRTGSKGQISVDWFPSEQLVKTAEIFGAAADGRLEVGQVPMPNIEGDVPMVQVPTLFAVWKSLDHIRAGMEPLREALQGEFAKKGIYLLGIGTYGGPYHLFTNQSIPYTPADIKGLKIRVSGKAQGSFMELCGASPVFVTAPETYVALQKKTVDGVLTIATTLYDYKYAEVLTYGSEFAAYPSPFFVNIANLKWWNGLTDEQRKIIQGAATQFATVGGQEALISLNAKTWDKIRVDLKTGQPSKEQAAAWSAAQDVANQNVLKTLGPDAQKILDVIKKYER